MRPPRRRHPLDRERQELVRRGATPLRIGRRKMRPDVAVGERAQNGVDQGMQRHVGIGMPRQRPRMRDAHAAEPDVIAVDESMDVVAGRGADIGERRKIGRRDAGEILFRGELHVAGFAFENVTVMPAHSASAASSVKSSRPATKARR